jgi:hypothetical protein
MNSPNQELGELLRSLREGRGECPNLETLAAYARGNLAERECAAVELHVARCGRCDLGLERLRGGQLGESAEDGPVPGELAAAERELTERMQKFFAAQPPRQTSRWGLKSLAWSPAPAWALALLLAVPAYRYWSDGRTRRPPPLPATLSAQLESAREVVLPEIRRGSGEAPAVRLGRRDEAVVLTFFVPVRQGFRYLARIEGTPREFLPSTEVVSFDGLGNFHLVVPPGVFRASSYQLIVNEDGNARGPWSFSLKFVE